MTRITGRRQLSAIQALAATLVPAALALALPAGAATIPPTVFTDDDTVNGNCTLREAVEAANTNLAVDACPAGEALPVVDVVGLPLGSYTLSLPDPIDITEDVDIFGADQTVTDLTGSGNLGLLRVPFGSAPEVSLRSLTLHDGHTVNRGGCLAVFGGLIQVTDATFDHCSADVDGGAILNEGASVSLTRVILTDNQAGSDGGAIVAFFPESVTSLVDSVVVGNRSEPATGFKNGGGISQRSGSLTATRTVISRNRSSLGGGISANGAIVLLRDVTLDRNFAANGGGAIRETQQSIIDLGRTTVSHNRSDVRGGGIRMSGGALFLQDSTVSANRAPEGGGIYGNNAQMFVNESTIAHNRAGVGSAILDERPMSGRTISNSLIEGRCAFADPDTHSDGGNLESPGNTCGLDQVDDQVGVVHHGITAVADHGGLTRTHLLLPGSPAIDTARTAECSATDQREGSRPIDGDGVGGADCDIGSVEVTLGETAPIFADSFESGDTLEWTEAVGLVVVP